MSNLREPLLNDSPRGAKKEAPKAGMPPNASMDGLSTEEAQAKLLVHGYNEIVEKKKHPFLKFATFFWGPMPWMIEIAAIISCAVQDWKDMAFLVALLVINGTIGFWEEFKAGSAVEALKASLALRARVRRDGDWTEIDARELVPGDIVFIRLGDVIPADAKILTDIPVEIDQSALTGESLPVTKIQGEEVFSGSVVKIGEAHCLIEATGADSFFGKAATLVSSVESQGHFQQVLFNVAKFLIAMAIVLVLVIFFQQVFTHEDVIPTLKLCLVLLVASIPIAMQVVCTATMAVGARALARENAIVSRLSAIEELAGMDILCSDKTGTLTLNKLTLDVPYIPDEVDLTGDDLIFLGAMACQRVTTQQEPIDQAITKKARASTKITLPLKDFNSASRTSTAITNAAEDSNMFLDQYEEIAFKPFDPVVKRAEATIRGPDGKIFKVCKGSPQIVLKICAGSGASAEFINSMYVEIDRFAGRGYRTLGVARTNEEDKWEFCGLIPLFDPPREDTKDTIERALARGVDVKMVTGDHIAIAKETARRLGIGTNMLGTEIFQTVHNMEGNSQVFAYPDLVEYADGFAQVFPEHKFLIVDLLQGKGHTVGMTGDGVNDAPALKKADIGIAVQGATDAARAAADIVLVSPGLSVIITAIIRSRMIFQRMRNYCIYRIACTIQILVFFFLSITCLDPSFKLPVFVIVLIAILNDGTIMTIAYDNVKPGEKPENWNLPIVCGVATSLGVVGVVASFLLLFLAREQDLFTHFGLPELSDGQLQALLYLQLSIGGQLTVFAARTRGPFFSRRPGTGLLCAFCVAQTIATLVAIYPLEPLQPMIGLAVTSKEANATGPIDAGYGWSYAAFVWVYCFVTFVVQDFVKLGAYQMFDLSDKRAEAKKDEDTQKKLMRSRYAGAGELPEHEAKVANLKKRRGSASSSNLDVAATDMPNVVSALLQRVAALEAEVSRMASTVAVVPSPPGKGKKK
eukprot:GFYU01001962.1.p1 GENE.GFYU01001962.1~~GFYU01001962.1.p1  ORF type:complete len:976 (-),score=405.00 GFYU01001962.1:1123-4050(-)